MRKRWAFAILLVLLLFATANAQKTYSTTGTYGFCPQHVDSLYCFVPLFGLQAYNNMPTFPENGIPVTFSPFSVQSNLNLRLDSLLGIETSTRPLPSPAAGISLTFDPMLGTFIPSSESLGPILSDRAETIGAHRLNLSFVYQHFGFEELDGQPLHSVGVTNAKFLGGEFAQSLALRVDEFTTFITYGLTKRIDVSAAFPVRAVHISATGQSVNPSGSFAGLPCSLIVDASLAGASLDGVKIAPLPQLIQTSALAACFPSFSDSSGSSGLSDITFRAKATLLQREHSGLGLGLDVRTPTGQPLNFLGSGAFGARPFLIGSWGRRFHRVYLGPHLNVGYQWNGSSLLGGVLLGEEGRLPHVFSYAVGSEVGLTKKVTMTLDLVGERLFSADRKYVFAQGAPSVVVTTRSISMKDGSIGVKVNPWRTLLLTGNLEDRLDRSGLRARLIPLAGLSYSF
jgi:hypothetical protein